MGQGESLDSTLACPLKPTTRGGLIPLLKQRKIIMTVGLVTLISTSALVFYIPPALPIGGIINTSQKSGVYDTLLLEVDQDGKLLRHQTIASKLNRGGFHPRQWGKMVGLDSGGFVIAGVHKIQDKDNDEAHVIWVIWTDENYVPIMNQTYGETTRIHSVTLMNNGNLAIAHVHESWKLLIINQDGGIVKEHSWSCGLPQLYSGRGFALVRWDSRPDDAWIAHISMDFNVVWNNTYPGLDYLQIVNDGVGGFVVLSGGQFIKLDRLGNMVWRKAYELTFSGLMRCKNGDFLLGRGGHRSIRVNSLGTVLWEKDSSFHKYGVLEISSERFLAYGETGARMEDGGLFLECYDGSGTSLWNNSILPDNGRFFVTDVISNGEGTFTILGVMYPELLPAILDCFSELDSDLLESYPLFGTV